MTLGWVTLKMSLLPFSGLAWSLNSWPRKSSSLSLCRWIMVPIPPSSTIILSRRMASISFCRVFFTPVLKKVKIWLSKLKGEKDRGRRFLRITGKPQNYTYWSPWKCLMLTLFLGSSFPGYPQHIPLSAVPNLLLASSPFPSVGDPT